VDVLFQLQLENPVGVALALLPALFNGAILVFAARELPSDRTTRAFSFFVVMLIAWQAFDVMVRAAATMEAAQAWRALLRVGQFIAIPAGLQFALRFSDYDDLAERSSFAALIFGPSLLFQGAYEAGLLRESLHWRPIWGWITIPDPSPLALIQTIWFGLLAASVVAVLAVNMSRSRGDPQRYAAARLIALGMAVPTAIGLVCEAVLPMASIQQVPLTSSTMSVFSLAVAVALARYDLFRVSTLATARAAIATVSDPLVIASPQGRVVYANAAAEGLVGAVLEGTPIDAMLPEAERKAFREGPWADCLRGARLAGVELSIRTGDGQDAPMLASLAPLPIRPRGLPGVVLFAHDVSALRAAMEAVEAASHAKSAFLANMSHELRTPLNAIIGYAQLLGEDHSDPQSRSDLARIEASGRYLLDLINDVLDLSKIESGRIEVVAETINLGDVIDEVVHDARELCRRNSNRFAWEASVRAPVVVDRVRLRQVLLNLLSNAAKFTRKGEVRLEVQRDGARIRVDVSDTGMGMDDEQLGRLFEPFIQVHREGVDTLGGTGLGLAISRRLCRLMGGDLTVRSRRGEGSTFSIWLVAAADTTGHPRA
jgi:PAS domain S-box-containing protein